MINHMEWAEDKYKNNAIYHRLCDTIAGLLYNKQITIHDCHMSVELADKIARKRELEHYDPSEIATSIVTLTEQAEHKRTHQHHKRYTCTGCGLECSVYVYTGPPCACIFGLNRIANWKEDKGE